MCPRGSMSCSGLSGLAGLMVPASSRARLLGPRGPVRSSCWLLRGLAALGWLQSSWSLAVLR